MDLPTPDQVTAQATNWSNTILVVFGIIGTVASAAIALYATLLAKINEAKIKAAADLNAANHKTNADGLAQHADQITQLALAMPTPAQIVQPVPIAPPAAPPVAVTVNELPVKTGTTI